MGIIESNLFPRVSRLLIYFWCYLEKFVQNPVCSLGKSKKIMKFVLEVHTIACFRAFIWLLLVKQKSLPVRCE